MKKLRSFCLFAIIISLVVMMTLPASASVGVCGDDTQWHLEDGVLTISGTGATADYDEDPAPWASRNATIREIIVEPGVTSVGNYLFANCTQVTAVTLPDGLIRLGECAFYNCKKLQTVVLPESLALIESHAFDGTGLTSVTIPSAVELVDNGAFSNCQSLMDVEIPADVTNFGTAVFSKSPALKSAGPLSSRANIRFGWTDAIPYQAFAQCESLTSVEIPDGITNIGEVAFYECTSLTTVKLPETLARICNSSFSCCTALEEIVIPVSVTDVEDSAFWGCTALNSVGYPGSAAQWETITIGDGNEPLTEADITYNYIAAPPSPITPPTHVTPAFLYPINIVENQGGIAAVSDSLLHKDAALVPNNSLFFRDSVVTLTVTPGTGYQLDTLMVHTHDGQLIELTKSENTYLFRMPAAPVTVSATFLPISSPFADVSESHPSYTAILWAVQQGITKGISDNHFAPESLATRGQIITFLWRMADAPQPGENPLFPNIPETAYYYEALCWAAEQGMVDPSADFDPNASCTQADMLTFLFHLYQTDSESADYSSAVQWALDCGILPDFDQFIPDAPCTRGEAVSLLYACESSL